MSDTLREAKAPATRSFNKNNELLLVLESGIGFGSRLHLVFKQSRIDVAVDIMLTHDNVDNSSLFLYHIIWRKNCIPSIQRRISRR